MNALHDLVPARAGMALANAAAAGMRKCRRVACSRALAAAAVMAASLVLPSYVSLASDQSVEITQSGGPAHTIDPAMVEQLPAILEHVLFLSRRGPEHQNYTRALLWSLLERAEVVGGDRRSRVQHTIVVTGRDGYVAVLALAEIDPDFEGK